MASIANKIHEAAPRNSELLGILSETDYAKPTLEQQKHYIDDLNSQLSGVQQRRQKLESQRAKELKDHEKYRDSVMKRFAYRVSGKTDKFAAKAEKEEREYFDVLQQSHMAKDEEESLKGMRSDARSVEEDLERQVARHVQAQQELDSLYDSIFQGPTPGFPEEDNSERNTQNALQTYHNSRMRMESEMKVVDTLNQARRRLNEASLNIEEALDHSRMDMFGGGTISDMMERNALSKAESEVSQMLSLVSQAQRMSPHVQGLPQVSIARGSLMSDVFFDNIFTDMAFHDKIKASRDELARCGNVLQDQLAKAHSRHQACQREMGVNSEALKTARTELQRARERIFERISNGQGTNQSEALSAPADNPPPY